jgi:hypothetical protein
MILTPDRSDSFLPLSECRAPQEALQRLSALGITTVEELRDVWAYDNRQLLIDYLGDSPMRLISIPPPAGAIRGAAAFGPGDSLNLLAVSPPPAPRRHPRGAILPPAQRRAKAEAPRPRDMPPKRQASPRTAASLVKKFPPVRDQGERGTCVAFASVAFLEFHLSGGAPTAPLLSEQFVYWACKDSDGLPDVEGTYVRAARAVIKSRGSCLAKTWRYHSLPNAQNEGQGPPPDRAVEEAKYHIWKTARVLKPKEVDVMKAVLDEKKPVVLSVRTFANWDFASVQRTGEILMPLPGSLPDGAHGVCLAGYELSDRHPGGGAFIFRNSWGLSWAKSEGRFSPGYGALPFEYVHQNGLEAFC